VPQASHPGSIVANLVNGVVASRRK
jgi:hypothetical protein